MNRARSLTVVALAAMAGACVDSIPAPPIPTQAEVAYGDRLYVVDFSPSSPRDNWCTTFGSVEFSQGSTITTPADGFAPIQLDQPHNCFIPVVPNTIKVDQVEVTNELFQICVDSGVCERPDPGDASKSMVCSEEDDGFDRCPVAEVPFDEAERICAFIGRRLPTMLEHIAIRQAGFGQPDLPNPPPLEPLEMRPYINGSTPPGPCADALLNSQVCNAVRPNPVGPSDGLTGGAANDVVNANGGEQVPIFDLTGSMTEWSSDAFPNVPLDPGLPWFCVAPLDTLDPPTCPVLGPGETEACVYANWQPEGHPYGLWPVCLTNPTAAFSGQIGALAGGGVLDTSTEGRVIGVFARRPEDNRRGDAGAQLGYGVRCVDDLPTNVDATGNPTDDFNFMQVRTSTVP